MVIAKNVLLGFGITDVIRNVMNYVDFLVRMMWVSAMNV